MTRAPTAIDAHPELLAWARQHCDGFAVDRSRTYGRESVLWQIGDAFVKQHESRPLFERERRCLERWVPRIPRADWWTTGELVAADERLGALVIRAVPGTLVEQLPAQRLATAYQLAGRFAARLHAVPPTDDVDVRTRVLADFTRYARAAEPHLEADTLAWARAVFDDGAAFADAVPVPVHADFSPRNWLLDDDDTFGVIDWERGHEDCWLIDGQRMVFDHWARDPSLRAAYYDGYGRAPTDDEERQLLLLTLSLAIGAIPWAIAREDHPFVAHSHEVIRQLRARL